MSKGNQTIGVAGGFNKQPTVNVPHNAYNYDSAFLGGTKGRGGSHTRANTYTNLQLKPHNYNHNAADYVEAWATNLVTPE